jgi:zinc protease
MRLWPILVGVVAVVAGLVGARTCADELRSYTVVVSTQTAGDGSWSKVVETLKAKHSARIFKFDKHVDESLVALKESMPRHIAFVATPTESTREFVAAVHRLTRRVDDDPYTDALWGIVTGYDAENALNIVQASSPLLVKKVAAGTDIDLAACVEGVWYCELKKNRMVRKLPNGAAVEERGPDDTTRALAATLADYRADLFVTSGHATERDWQIGFAYRNGSFRSQGGRLFGHPSGADSNDGDPFEIQSDNPKVYLAVGNCLMGHIDSQDAMALAWLNSAGVRQMAGYTVLTWYGYAGWGMLDYYVEQPGRFNMAEAFFANQQALLHRLETEFPEVARENPEPGKTRGRGDAAGLLHDRDVLAFYGDPAWDARLAAGPLRWEQSLVEKDGKWTLTITPRAGADTFKPVNKNGSQRGGRPIVALLPRRIGKVEIESGADLKPLITDDFVLVPLPAGAVKEKYEVVFREAQ